MADKADSYDKLERDRERILMLGHAFIGIPIDDEHEADIRRRREKKAKDQFAQQEAANNVHASSPTSQMDKRTPSSPSPEYRSSLGSQISTHSDQTDLKGRRTTSVQRDAESPDPFLDRDNREENTPENIWPILLLFDNNKHFESKVLLDSGAEDNWISERTVKENGLPWESNEQDGNEKDEYEDVNGRVVKSCGLVRALWIFRHKTIPVEFKIARTSHASWQVIFGYRHLIETNVITFHTNETNRLVAPLIKKERKPTAEQRQQIERNEEVSRTASSKIHDFLEWKKRMSEAGWHWDKEHNNFYRDTVQGGKAWCKDGWHVNFTVRDTSDRT